MTEKLGNPFKISELVETVNNLVDTAYDDSKVVHKSGDETITGFKTFTGYNRSIIALKNSNITYNTAPSSDTNTEISFRDKNDNGMGILRHVRYANNDTCMYLAVRGADGDWSKTLTVGRRADGTIYTSAPTPSTDDNSTNIATTAFVKAQGYAVDSGLVHKTGNETITGSKTFTSYQYIKNVDCSIANPPASTSWRYIDCIDSNGVRIGVIGSQINTDGTRGVYLQAGNEGNISIFTNGTTAYTSTVTPPASDNSTKIATTAWVRSNGVIAASFYSSNGYVKFNHGLIIQWLYFAVSNNYVTVTFPTSFSNTNYAIVQTPISNNGTFPGGAWTGIRDKTMTNVKLGIRAGAGVGADTSYSHAIAIGY